jgi:hypothetical protein
MVETPAVRKNRLPPAFWASLKHCSSMTSRKIWRLDLERKYHSSRGNLRAISDVGVIPRVEAVA